MDKSAEELAKALELDPKFPGMEEASNPQLKPLTYIGSDIYQPTHEEIIPHIFTAALWSGIIFLILGYIPVRSNEAAKLSLYLIIVGFSGLILAYIYSLIALYRCWSILQKFGVRTTPGKAVGFLFIPFYNLYWPFVAINGLAKDANLFLRQRKIYSKNISEDLSLAICIICLIPFINFIAPIFFNILIYRWARFNNFVIANWDKGFKRINRIEERLYDTAAREVDTKQVAPGLMAKAFSECDGDEKKAAARYIKYRVAQLQEELAMEEEEKRKADEELRWQQQHSFVREKAKICPKCGGEAGEGWLECRFCRYKFDSRSKSF